MFKIVYSMKTHVFQIIVFSFVFIACSKIDNVSPVPEIHYRDFTLYQGVDELGNQMYFGTLLFSFIDGDADFGSYYQDTTEFNIFLTPLEKIEGDYFIIESMPDSLNNYRVIYNSKLSRTGQNKTIKGDIEIEIRYPLNFEHDTIRYDFFIMDRARNFSNTESTDDISFP
jgi:hypothetical protein